MGVLLRRKLIALDDALWRLTDAGRYVLKQAADPVAGALDAAPLDDEPQSDDERAKVKASRAAGRYIAIDQRVPKR